MNSTDLVDLAFFVLQMGIQYDKVQPRLSGLVDHFIVVLEGTT